MPHVHLLGIAGTFMAGLAVLAKQSGFKVTGSDHAVYPPMSDILDKNSIDYTDSYSLNNNKDNLDRADCIVIGNVITRNNPCVEYILDNKLNFSSGPAWLYNNLLNKKWVLAVSGTHGKTTTSSMLAWILEDNNLNPGFLIGGFSNNFSTSSRITDSKYFVIEADEYDTAFFDKRPKFLHYYPNSLVINNIEFDHADIYANLEEIEKQFGYLLRLIPKHNGMVIAPEELRLNFTDSSPKNILYKCADFAKDSQNNFGFFNITNKLNKKSKNLQAKLIKADASEFECYFNNQLQGTVKWNCLGHHNVNNAMAAILAAHSVGIAMPDAIKSLSSFKGAARRLEKKAELNNNIIIFDDFAHHPTAIKTTTDGLKEHYGTRRLVVVVDFSSYSMRNKTHTDSSFTKALDKADVVYLYQDSRVNWDGSNLLELIKQEKQAYLYNSDMDLINHMAQSLQSNDVVVFMTKSDFNKKITELATLLVASYEKCE